MKLYYAFVLIGLVVMPTAEAQSAVVPEMVQDDYAETVDEQEEVVETVKLGGEDNAAVMQGGVQQADAYEQTADPESPLNVNINHDGADETPVGTTEVKPVVTVDEVAEHDPSRVAYARTRKKCAHSFSDHSRTSRHDY